MKLGLVQFAPIWESKIENMEKIKSLVNTFKEEVSLLIMPEMTLTGFTMNSKDYGEDLDGPGFRYFMELSAKLKTDIIAGLIEKEEKRYFNSLVHFDSMGLIKAVYRKIHPFSLASEDKIFFRGNETVISNFELHKIGLSICYDLRFPELYRIYAKEKAEIMINIANWPFKRIEHWKHLLRARAIENQCFVIGVNRTGEDPYQQYPGNSAVYDPMGDEVFQTDNEEKVYFIEIDLNEVKNVRDNLGFLNDIKLI